MTRPFIWTREWTMSDPHTLHAAYSSTSTMPHYRMPDNTWVTDEKMAREAWRVHLEEERVRNRADAWEAWRAFLEEERVRNSG